MAVSTRKKSADKEKPADNEKECMAGESHGSVCLNTVFVVPREKIPKEYGTSVRQTELEVVARVVSQVCGGVFKRGDSCFYIRLPDIQGDAEWCDRNILRRYYLDNPKSDGAIISLADKIAGDVAEQGCSGCVGYVLIEKILKSRIMTYDKFTED